MEIDKKLHDEIKEYCKLNGLKITQFINTLLKRAFMIEKYGDSPFQRNEYFPTPIFVEESLKEEKKDDILTDKVEEIIPETVEMTENEDNGIKFVEIKKTKKRKLK